VEVAIIVDVVVCLTPPESLKVTVAEAAVKVTGKVKVADGLVTGAVGVTTPTPEVAEGIDVVQAEEGLMRAQQLALWSMSAILELLYLLQGPSSE